MTWILKKKINQKQSINFLEITDKPEEEKKNKIVKFKAKPRFLLKIKRLSNIPVVAIGGINEKNYKKLLLNKANFLAISGYIWKNKKLKPQDAIKNLI